MKPMRFHVEADGLTCRPRFDRRYAVVDSFSMGWDGKPVPVLQTDDPRRAIEYADECNRPLVWDCRNNEWVD